MLYKKLEFFSYLFFTGANFALFVYNHSPMSSHSWSKGSQGISKATSRHSFSRPFSSWKHYCSFAACFWPLPRVILPALPAKKGWQEKSLICSRQNQSGLTYLNGERARADDIAQDLFGSTHPCCPLSSRTARAVPPAGDTKRHWAGWWHQPSITWHGWSIRVLWKAQRSTGQGQG